MKPNHPYRLFAPRASTPTPRNPSLDRRPAQTPPPATSWWAVPMTREQFDAEHAKQVQRMLAVSTTQHVQRREGGCVSEKMPPKQYPVRELPSMLTVKAPHEWTDYDAVQIQVSITPTRGPEDTDPHSSVYSRFWITRIEAQDQRALEYLTRQMVELAMREWNKPR